MKKSLKLALAVIVKGSDEEAIVLNKLLNNVEKYVDGMFITITYKKGEKPNEKVEKICKLFNANISYFEWVNDFSKARNFNFSQVPDEYDYIMWADADDMFRGIEKLRPTIEDNQDKDAFSMFYLYAFDEHNNPTVVHQKTMIVRNDGCVEWAGALHEDFKQNRELKIYFIKGIERMHMSNKERYEAAKSRNVEVAKQDAKNNPKDPRVYWNLGQALHGNGEFKESNKAFDKFLEKSGSSDEKYIVRLRRAINFWMLGQISKAIDECRYAIGTKPDFPDAYHTMGDILVGSSRFEDAVEMYVTGMTKKPPYYEIIVYNPRDYDYVPMMKCANAYMNMHRADMALILLKQCQKIYPNDNHLKRLVNQVGSEAERVTKAIKEIPRLSKIKDDKKLKKELEDLPNEIKSHPHICLLRNTRFIKKKSSGKDVVIFCGYTSEVWTPETAETDGIGGSEEAVIHLAKRWKKAGYNVTVYSRCGHEELEFDGVKYKPEWSWNFRDKQDITILWRTPKWVDYEINSDKIFIDLHDVISPGEFTPKRLEKIDKIFVKTKFHQSLYEKVQKEKFVIIPNGIDSKVFEQEVVKNPKLVINTSSPDRSLSAFIEIARIVKKEIPDAEFKWAYGWNVFDAVHGENEAVMEWKANIISQMKNLGIENLGRISHSEVAKLYLDANVLLYPTEFAEIHCITAVKAQAAGAIPVTTDFAALNETVQYGYKAHSDKNKDNWSYPNQFDFSLVDENEKKQMARQVIYHLQHPDENREKMRQWARETYDWDKIANKWIKEF